MTSRTPATRPGNPWAPSAAACVHTLDSWSRPETAIARTIAARWPGSTRSVRSKNTTPQIPLIGILPEHARRYPRGTKRQGSRAAGNFLHVVPRASLLNLALITESPRLGRSLTRKLHIPILIVRFRQPGVSEREIGIQL